MGPLADPTQWTINGATTFPPAVIRDALLDDVPVLALLHPGADRSLLLATIEQRTALGYACTGFASCHVRARAVGDQLVLTITEGSRDRCAAVMVVGAKEVPAADLVAALTSGWMDADGTKVAAAWTSGKPVDHDLDALKGLADQAARFYHDRHHPQARISADLVAGTSGLDLRLTVNSEGPAVRIGTITLRGCERFDQAAVRALIPVHSGDLLPGNATSVITTALRACGRFRTQQATIELADDAPLANLTITVAEGLNTPAPEMPLTAVQEAAVRAAQWLAEHGNHGPEQLLLTVSSPAFTGESIIAGDVGFMLSGRVADHGGWAGGTLLLRGVADQWLLTEHSHGRLHLPPLAWTLDLTEEGMVQLEPPNGSPNPHENSMRFSLTPSTRTAGKPPLTMNLAMAPFCALSLVTRPGVTATIADGILSIDDHPGFHLTADAVSGRLLGMDLASADQPPGTALHVTLQITGDNALAAAASRLEALPLRVVDDHPWISAVQLLLDETCAVALHKQPAPTADRDMLVLAAGLSPWVCTQLLVPLEQRLRAKDGADDTAVDEDRFAIPPVFPANRDQMTMLVGEGCKMLARSLAGLYPADSWPVTLPRSLFLVLRGQGGAGLQSLSDLANAEHTGPLGCLGAAELLAYIRHPGASIFAERGLTQLDNAGFAKELVLLAPITSGVVQALDALPVDPPWLADLTPERRTLVASILTAAHVPGPDTVRLHTMASLIWHGWLHDWTAAKLTAIAHPEPP